MKLSSIIMQFLGSEYLSVNTNFGLFVLILSSTLQLSHFDCLNKVQKVGKGTENDVWVYTVRSVVISVISS